MPGRMVKFADTSNTICRPTRDDERDVMRNFAAHASHCPRCEDPFRAYLTDGTLCDRGNAYARDVYIYSRAGKAYSVIDRNAANACIQIEIPAKCDAIRGLLKAMDHGLKVRRPALRPVVSYDQRDGYEVTERAEGGDQLSDWRDGHKIIEVASRRREGRRRTRQGRWV